MKRARFVADAAYLTFLAKLRLARMEAGISQRELARRLGIHHSRVVRSEAQPPQRALDIVETRAWLQALGLSVVQFTRELDLDLEALLSATNTASAVKATADEPPTTEVAKIEAQ